MCVALRERERERERENYFNWMYNTLNNDLWRETKLYRPETLTDFDINIFLDLSIHSRH